MRSVPPVKSVQPVKSGPSTRSEPSVTWIRPRKASQLTGDLGAGSAGSLGAGLLSGGLRSVGDVLRVAESVLLSGGQQTARRNAWDAVCENRRLAQDREDVRGALARSTH